MNITPSHNKPRQVALVTPGFNCLRVETKDDSYLARGPNQVYAALVSLSRHAVYTSGSLLGLLHTTGADYWTAATWKGRATSMTLDGTRTPVVSVRGTLDGSPNPFASLCIATDWVAEQGVRAGSLSSMAWGLWRATLSRPVSIASVPGFAHEGLYGGRQEVPVDLTNQDGSPRRYQHMAAVDLSKAYPTAMASRPYAYTLREVSEKSDLDPALAGLARATVLVPYDLPFAPLPQRVTPEAISWPWGRVEGVWPWAELAYAKSLGCEVKVSRSFAPMQQGQPFTDWWAVLSLGHLLADPWGATLVKAIGNALWGMFGMVGNMRGVVRWTDPAGNHPVLVPKRGKPLPQASTAHVAAETTSRVRIRLLEEGLYGLGGRPVHIDTDGVIVARTIAAKVPQTCGPGEWRVKTDMARLEIRAPQCYRFKCKGPCCTATGDKSHGNWHYVTAGTTGTHAASLFDKLDRPTRVAIFDRDMVLPNSRNGVACDYDQLVREGRRTQAQMFGEGLG